MFEVMLCSIFTLLPDYLIRRYVQGKRIGKEITFYSVWFELRYGITGCAALTVLLITVVFYNHPSTSNATLVFRAVPVITEISGRVEEVFVGPRGELKAGDPIFRLDPSAAQAEVKTANQRITEVDALILQAKADLGAATGQLRQALGAYQQALEELESKEILRRRNPDIVATRQIENLQTIVETRQGAVDAAQAAQQAADLAITTVLPAQRQTAQAQLEEAIVKLDKMVIRAGVDGRVEQFTLRVGDFVNPFMRPAGVFIPSDAGRTTVVGAFGQIEAQVLKVGMEAEISCAALPLTIIPMIITDVQEEIASGQIRTSDRLADVGDRGNRPPGNVLAYMEPLYEGGLDGLPPGASCMANAYTNNHEKLQDPNISMIRYIALHVVDTLAILHAGILRSQTLTLPVRTLVLSGGH
ncbi:MAG: HlyD family secretion protein [Alphaproteobacteria bacterium]|nr:HlyD family secretion protein [Alphaproteobacteria bacterium SS10]